MSNEIGQKRPEYFKRAGALMGAETFKKYQGILVDAPWPYMTFNAAAVPARGDQPYKVMSWDDIFALPVADFAADDCVLFCWVCWPSLPLALQAIEGWGFTYKTCAFCWVKGKALPLFDAEEFPEMFNDKMGLGYWTRANSEVCLLATRGKPKRKDAGVRQIIKAPLREHSRKPDEQYDCIERLVDGPYLEMFARQRWPGWDAWGNQTDKFEAALPEAMAMDAHEGVLLKRGNA